jgi:transposase InsO family protein
MQVYGAILPGAAAVARLLPLAAAHVRAEAALSAKARHRLKIIRWYEEHGRNARLTCRHFAWSPSTFYLWLHRYQRQGPRALEERSRRPRRVRKPSWNKVLAQAVLRLREKYPRWGKDKLVVLLRKEGRQVSTSMVGRILREIKERGLLWEPDLRDPWQLRRPQRRPYAVRKPRDYLPAAPGDLVQVDGGSEFKAQFEAACQQRGLQLFLLPPRSPKLNGHVERAHRTHREEFYQVVDLPDTLAQLRERLRAQETVYNTIRPHQALGQRTPWEFYQQWLSTQTERG